LQKRLFNQIQFSISGQTAPDKSANDVLLQIMELDSSISDLQTKKLLIIDGMYHRAYDTLEALFS
jgi:hypothetical protein